MKDDNQLLNAAYKKAIIDQTISLARTGFTNLSLLESDLRGKKIYQTTTWPVELIFRKLVKNIHQRTGVRQNDRFEIVRSIRRLCEEGVSFRVYKADIKSFYETIDTSYVLKCLRDDFKTSPSNLKLLSSFFETLTGAAVRGLPRGLAISACLSEYAMREFDKSLFDDRKVFYYARYVDDMIIFTDGTEDSAKFLDDLGKKLPPGLKWNRKKTKPKDFKDSYAEKSEDVFVDKFQFLGFEFNVHKNSGPKRQRVRKVIVDISPNKISKMKTKLILSAREFISNGNFVLLERRIKLLTGNYTFYDHSRRQFRRAGFYYSYGMIDASISKALDEVDLFLKQMLLSKHGKTFAPFHAALSTTNRKKLLTYSFKKNFLEKRHFKFSAEKLNAALECWKYA
ncbi:antiviral reverse transcriptase Drt3a [Asticcacaulis sp.]|uniref:antiviral reverse transcriptase Drt3a n=1 Tax=Asticcacaulis sp. TaxID=1872648 RepID=UPI00391C3F3D